jgi:hypothetical protein
VQAYLLDARVSRPLPALRRRKADGRQPLVVCGWKLGCEERQSEPPCCTTFGWRLAVIFFGNLFVSYDIAACSAGIVN